MSILNARPDISFEYVFLTTRFPIRKLSEGTSLAFIFEKYEEMAGIERKPFDGKGFHYCLTGPWSDENGFSETISLVQY